MALPATTPSGIYGRDLHALAAIERLRFFPLGVVAGSGSWLIDDSGRRLLDMSGSWGAALLGYAHPAVVAAVTDAVARMPGASSLSAANVEAVALAEELLAEHPDPHDRRVYLGLAGSDANSAAIRAARAATRRPRVLSFRGSYHGGVGEAQRVSGLHVEAGTEPDPGLVLLPYPDSYRPHVRDATPGEVLADVLHRAERELAHEDVALLLVEPLMSDGGVIVPPDGFLAALRALCDAYGTLLACDEVKVGLGRAGGDLHAFASSGTVPDLVTYGKGLGGGLPLAATVGPAEVLDAAAGQLLLTTAGNPVTAAAGRAVLRTVRAQQLWRAADERGELLREGLDGLAARHPSVGQVRGRGLALGVDLVEDRETRTPAGGLAAKVAFRAWQLGVVFYYVGPGSNVVELTPPLTLTQNEVELALAVLDQALTDVAAGAVSDQAVAPFRGW